MKLKLVIIGIVIATSSAILYVKTPSLISQMVHSMMSMAGPSTSSSTFNTSGMLHAMGYPSRTVVIPIMQSSFIGFGIMGLIMTIYGMAAKKYKRQFVAKSSPDQEHEKEESHAKSQPDNSQKNYKALSKLQERLANGEITTSEFERIKKLLD